MKKVKKVKGIKKILKNQKITKKKKNITFSNRYLFAFTSLFLFINLLYLIGIIYINSNYHITINTTTPQNIQEEMKFVFVDEDNTQYEVFQKDIHGSLINWDFLFKKRESDEKNEQNKKSKKFLGDIINEIKKGIEEKKDIKEEKKIEEKNGNLINEEKRNCMLPRGKEIKDKEFVLAYQQRQDEVNFCNIQKRTCNNGKLSGSYSQKSCKENNKDNRINYSTFKLYNEKKPNKLIQSNNKPNKYNKNYVEKKISKTIRDNNKKQKKIVKLEIEKNQIQEVQDCITPRGEINYHGQFIKAYKKKYGFIDEGCQVELRICLNGKLEGSFKNKSCTYIDGVTKNERYDNPDNIKEEENTESIDFLLKELIKIID